MNRSHVSLHRVFASLRAGRNAGKSAQEVREPSAPVAPARPLRIVLYSHDTQGLGHMRRNLLIAKALLKLEPRPVVLLVSGAHQIGRLAIPKGIDCLTLPALGKCPDGQYEPRSLSVSLERLMAMRAATIQSAIETFDPDVLLADKVPLGAFGELEPSLQWLKARGKARCVLGLREVLDAPATVRKEWHKAGSDQAISSYYDAIWVYGDRAIYDPVREYGFVRDVARKIRYTGYLDRSADTEELDDETARMMDTLRLPSDARVALCYVGGGQDGDAVAEAFARAELPPNTVGVIVTGPFMSPEQQRHLQSVAADASRLRILTFVAETAPLLRRASWVVCMGGYNTVCEVLAFEKQALIVPRVEPRSEQLIRAERLCERGLVDMLLPSELTPEAIGDWLRRTPGRRRNIREHVDMNALTRLPGLVRDLVSPWQQAAEVRYATA